MEYIVILGNLVPVSEAVEIRIQDEPRSIEEEVRQDVENRKLRLLQDERNLTEDIEQLARERDRLRRVFADAGSKLKKIEGEMKDLESRRSNIHKEWIGFGN